MNKEGTFYFAQAQAKLAASPSHPCGLGLETTTPTDSRGKSGYLYTLCLKNSVFLMVQRIS